MAVSLDIVRTLVEARSQAERLEIAASGQIVHPGQLPMYWRIEFEERAAILEYDGGLSRDAADERALHEIVERLKRKGKGQAGS